MKRKLQTMLLKKQAQQTVLQKKPTQQVLKKQAQQTVLQKKPTQQKQQPTIPVLKKPLKLKKTSLA